jgi:hypothetical protein
MKPLSGGNFRFLIPLLLTGYFLPLNPELGTRIAIGRWGRQPKEVHSEKLHEYGG